MSGFCSGTGRGLAYAFEHEITYSLGEFALFYTPLVNDLRQVRPCHGAHYNSSN